MFDDKFGVVGDSGDLVDRRDNIDIGCGVSTSENRYIGFIGFRCVGGFDESAVFEFRLVLVFI